MAPPSSRHAVLLDSKVLLKERECYWIPHPSKVYVMVMVRRIEGDRCWVTTVEEKKDLELDIYYPFFPINSFVVDDMTALPNLHEVCFMYVCMLVCMYVCMFVCMCVCIFQYQFIITSSYRIFEIIV